MVTKSKYLIILLLIICSHCFSQSKAINSAILNFGSNACGDRIGVTFSLIGNPITAPYTMASCNINPPFGDVFNRFIAYNPRDNKVYINDINAGDSRLYIYDMGLPLTYSCPAIMPVVPTYNYLYVPNNFEFDINGDFWSIRGLAGNDAIIERFDEATGTILFSKTLNFPPGNVPNTLGSGDIVIIPNGRMFIVMGSPISKFYEITNYTNAVGNATANFIQDMPSTCYGILYLNGTIELTGTNFSTSCYRYIYDIPSNVMGPQQSFQMGYMPVDNSSISPATGLSKKLIGSANVDSTTEDIVYEIYAKNLGNVKLDNFNITDDLGAIFGAANVSFVSATIVFGSNPGNLILNPIYDGVSNIKIFNDNQVLSNLTNGYVAVRIALRATNLISNTIYYNTAKSTGEIGNLGSRIIVIDSSNNGTSAAIDPNKDGDAGDINENIPTPYFFGTILPIRFIDAKAGRINDNLHNIKWTIAPPPTPVAKFEVEYSEDRSNWKVAGTVAGEAGKNDYYLNYRTYSTNTIYYRVKAYESSGKSYISTISLVKKVSEEQTIKVSPNPADGFIGVYSSDDNFSENRRVQIIDVSGKKILDQPYIKQYLELNTAAFPNGYYVVNISDRGKVVSTQVLVKHK